MGMGIIDYTSMLLNDGISGDSNITSFLCLDCDEKFTIFAMSKDGLRKCPHCGSYVLVKETAEEQMSPTPGKPNKFRQFHSGEHL